MLNNNKKQETQFFGTKCGNANSIAAGYATETTNYGEIATGILNKSTKGDNPNSPEGVVGDPKATLFSVGCGTKEERKNALEVKGDGSVIISGKDGSDVNIADLAEKLDQPSIDLSEYVNKNELAATESAIQKQIATKANVQDVTNAIGELQDSIKNIAVTGGASTAAAVTFDNAASGMTAVNAQSAIEELNVKKLAKADIVQEPGNSKELVMSQKAVSDKLKGLSTEIIYDVSARNDGAVFESLQDLLSSSNLSTLIPTSVRHGGMSIRFVQSSDNKYVQYRLMANTFSTTVADWQGVDDEPTDGSDNLVKSGGINSRLNEVADIRKKVNSIFSLLPNQLDSTFTQGEGYAYKDYTSFNPSYDIIRFEVNGNRRLNSGVEYLFFAKFKIVIEEAFTFNVHVSAGSATNIVEPTEKYNTGEIISVYLGKATGNGKSSYFRAAYINEFKRLNAQGSSTVQNVHAEYYGGYVVEKTQLSDIPESSYQEVAEKLDYTNTACTIIVDGKVTKLENRVNVLEENTSDISIIREDVDLLNNNSKKIDSSFDISYNAAGWENGIVDSENHLLYIDNNQASSTSIYQVFRNTLKGLIANKKYAIFVKIREELDEEDANNWTVNTRCGGYTGGMSERPKYTIKMNQDYCLYVGEFTFSSSGWFYPVEIQQFRLNGQASSRKINAKGIYYGGYVIDTDLIRGIDRQHFAQLLDYSNSYTVISNNTINAATSFFSNISGEATHSVNSDISSETNRVRTAYEDKLVGLYGDSLVTYTSDFYKKYFKPLGMKTSLVGSGGGQVNNIGKSGYCTIERLALLPKNMKVLCFWGGANDGNYYIDKTQPDWIDNSKFGTIDDKPLGVADMFNYHLTVENMDDLNTPGITKTFFQAYKTLLRNISLLFPHTLLICVTQYRAYYYDWTQGKDKIMFRKNWPRLIAAEKACCEEYSVPVCDLYTKAGVNDSNCFTMLNDDGGSLIHPHGWLGERCVNLIAQTVKENMFIAEPTNAWTYNLRNDDKDVREFKEYLVDLRSETEINYMTLEEAIQGFISYTTEKSITLKNNMYLVFYNSKYGNSVGYFLIDYSNPSDVNSWQQWVESTVYDMRKKDATLEIEYGVQTLSEAIASFTHKATVEQWTYNNNMYMYFLTDDNGSWSMYRLATPATPSSTSSWTFVKSGQANAQLL